MSGTSLDGIDVAIVDIRGKTASSPSRSTRFPIPRPCAKRCWRVSNSMTHTAAIARLHFLLGELYAEAVRETCRRRRVPLHSISLCGMHGQTIFHEGAPVKYLGRRVASTLPDRRGGGGRRAHRPAGPSPISASAISPPAGKARRWCLYVDYLLFRHRRIGRVALNIGGIANITVIPGGRSRATTSWRSTPVPATW